VVAGDVTIYLPLAGLLDLDAERARLDKEIAQAQAEVAHCEQLLANPNFTSRAKPGVVAREQTKLAQAQDRLAQLERRYAELFG